MAIPLTHDEPPPELSDGARSLMAHLAEKWTLLILVQLCHGPLRFNALRRSVGPVTPKALAQTLRRLERSGLIARQIVPGSPPGVEYRGTELGFALAPAIRALVQWASTNFEEIEHAQRQYDARDEK
jgi:DNA-binding HxlR family transcriptional regulator